MADQTEALAAWKSNLTLLQTAVASWRIVAAFITTSFAAIFLLGPFFIPIPFAVLLAGSALSALDPRVLALFLRFVRSPSTPHIPAKAPLSAYIGAAIMLAESIVLMVLPMAIMIQRGAFCRYNIICNAITRGS